MHHRRHLSIHVAPGDAVAEMRRVLDARAEDLLKVLSAEADIPQHTAVCLVDEAIDRLCMHLVRVHCEVVQAAPSGRGLAPWQVKRVTDYMREHFHRQIRLEELAALVNLSRFHFCTAFRLATGRTPHDWLMTHRMERARALLGNSTLSVTEIALAVGYETSSAFAASFRRIVGQSPSQYRRQQAGPFALLADEATR